MRGRAIAPTVTELSIHSNTGVLPTIPMLPAKLAKQGTSSHLFSFWGKDEKHPWNPTFGT